MVHENPDSAPPIYGDVGVIALVYHLWQPQWMTPHHVLSRLARYFHVVWVNPAHEWRETPARIRVGRRPVECEGLPPGFTVYRPEAWLPKFYTPKWLDNLTFALRLKRASQQLKRRGCQKLVLYVWHPQFEGALRSLPHDFSCYHIDDDYSFSGKAGPESEAERRLIASVGHVFLISPGLLEGRGQINPETTVVPEGVDFAAYATPVDAPADIARVPRPRVGYTGFLKNQLDWPLLVELTGRHPDWSFVLVGPTKHQPEIGTFLAQLRGRPNVWLLGAKTAQQLAAYPQHFDVCIMPYRVDSYTNLIYPLKLHEYLAGGRPIVASPIRSLLGFSDLMRLEHTADGWSRALAASLLPAANSTTAVAARRRAARQHDWQGLVGLIAQKICEGLG